MHNIRLDNGEFTDTEFTHRTNSCPSQDMQNQSQCAAGIAIRSSGQGRGYRKMAHSSSPQVLLYIDTMWED